MKMGDIVVGGTYKAKVNEAIVTVRVDKISLPDRKFGTRAGPRYHVTNLKTGRTTTFKSAAKFRSAVSGKKAIAVAPKPVEPIGLSKAMEADAIRWANEQAAPVVKKRRLFDEPEEESCSDTSGSCASLNSMPSTTVLCPVTSPAPTVVPSPVTPVFASGGDLLALASKFGSTPTKPFNNAPHLEVLALAGTGKTTTAIQGLIQAKGGKTRITPSPQQEAIWKSLASGDLGSVRLSSFSSGITGELKVQVAECGLDKKGVEARGIHSLGYAALLKALGRKVEPNAFAVEDIIGKVLGGNARDLKRIKGTAEVIKATDALVSLCKATMTEPTDTELDRLTSRYAVEMGTSRRRVYELVPDVLERCKTPTNRIAFDDQIWLPLVYGLTIPKVDTQIIDESQDLNRMQQELMYKAGHRVVFVGDKHQAIYGFAGADAESMNRMKGTLAGTDRNCVTMPLTVTRRCAKLIVNEAKRYVPEYEAHESNPLGDVLTALYPVQGKGESQTILSFKESYASKCVGGDLVLCRTNAPLVHECFSFLREGITANILGRKIGEGLIALVNKLNPASIVELIKRLEEWLQVELELENAKKEPSETRIEELCDKRAVIMVFIDGCQTVQHVIDKISARFTDDHKAPGIRLATIHKSKGLEAENVHWLRPPGIGPRRDKMQAWELEQEINLEYVATTRAKLKLTYVS